MLISVLLEYEGLISQERPIPIEGTAQLSDLERQAAETTGDLGQFASFTPESINYYKRCWCFS